MMKSFIQLCTFFIRLNLLLSCKLKYDCMKCYTLDNFENIDSCLSIYNIHVNE